MTIVPNDRGRRGATYTLLTPANRYASRLPAMSGSIVFKLVTPRLTPARFGQYLIVIGDHPVDVHVDSPFEHFLLGQSGQAQVRIAGGEPLRLGDGGLVYIGPNIAFSLLGEPSAELHWIKRHYEAIDGLAAPTLQSGRLADTERTATPVPGLHRRELIDPLDPAFDFNISHMEFDPGVALSQIDEEHGLYMTSGGGTYHLDGTQLEVQADDFIYMAPYCPRDSAPAQAARRTSFTKTSTATGSDMRGNSERSAKWQPTTSWGHRTCSRGARHVRQRRRDQPTRAQRFGAITASSNKRA